MMKSAINSTFNNWILPNPTNYLKIRLRPCNWLKDHLVSSIVTVFQYPIDLKYFIQKYCCYNAINRYGYIHF